MDRRQFGEEAWSAVEQQQQQQQPTAKSRQQGLPEETRPGQLCRSQGYSAAHSDAAAAAAAAPVAAVSSDSASAVAAAVAAVAAPVVAVAAVAAAAAAAAAPRPRLKRQDTPWEEPLLLHQGTSSSSDLSSIPEVDEWWDQVLSAAAEEDGGKEASKGTSTLDPPPPPQPSLSRSHPPRRRKQRVDPLDMMTLEEFLESTAKDRPGRRGEGRRSRSSRLGSPTPTNWLSAAVARARSLSPRLFSPRRPN